MSDFNIKALKGGIREYINILIALYSIYDNNDVINTLNDFYKELDEIDNILDLNIIKDKIIAVQDSTTIDTNKKIIKDFNASDRELSEREKGLVARGYKKEDVLYLSGFTNEHLEIISNLIINNSIKNIKSVVNPVCVIIGGQPGCGKSTTSLMMLKDSFFIDGAFEVGIDNYRPYHPNYLKIEEAIKEHWKNRTRTENDSPGNDIADFTHQFAGDIADYIVNKLINNTNKYNLIIEWGMRTSEEPLKMMKLLKDNDYNTIVDFVVVNKKASYEASISRADAMDGLLHIVRRIPKNFHDLCIETLPDSCNKIYQEGFINNNYISHFILSDRDGNYIWNNSDEGTPGDLYYNYLNN